MQPATSPVSEIDRCCALCLRCAETCVRHLHHHCLPAGGRHAAAPHVQVMTDCSGICRLAADFMMRGSPHHWEVCGVCAAICDECAESCAALEDMQACVDACRACAAACRDMAA